MAAPALIDLVMDWLNHNYPNMFRIGLDGLDGPDYYRIVAESYNYHSDVLHVCDDYVWLFNSDSKVELAYIKVYAADSSFFSQLNDCIVKYWL